MMNVVVEAAGWTGAAGILLAYVLVSSGTVRGTAVSYQMLNLVAGGLLVANSAYHGALPSTGLNVAWMTIALLALARAGVVSGAEPAEEGGDEGTSSPDGASPESR